MEFTILFFLLSPLSINSLAPDISLSIIELETSFRDSNFPLTETVKHKLTFIFNCYFNRFMTYWSAVKRIATKPDGITKVHKQL